MTETPSLSMPPVMRAQLTVAIPVARSDVASILYPPFTWEMQKKIDYIRYNATALLFMYSVREINETYQT